MGRDFREHQINIFAVPFLKVGFRFRHKQAVLEELAKYDKNNFSSARYTPCPGERVIKKQKPQAPREADASYLPDALRGKHFDAYWQICRTLGCPKRVAQKTLDYQEDVEQEVDAD